MTTPARLVTKGNAIATVSCRRPSAWVAAKTTKKSATAALHEVRKCAASSPAWLNRSSNQSNQQDLIGEMEANRQQKPACREESLLEREAEQRRKVADGRCDECLGRLPEPVARCRA